MPKIGDAGDLVDAEPFKRSDWGPERASGLKMIGQWGPYVYWSSASLYVYQKRGPLAHFVAAKDIRGQVDLDFPAEKGRPMILGTTQGPQCYDWITEPEWMEMALDCYLLNGWEGAKSYFFPDGYDARYWRAYARAATRAAKYEDYTLGGVRDDASVSLEPVAEYAVPCHYVTLYIPKHRNVPLLQRAVWERDGRRIVGVFNFWEKGEAFFMLKCRGLKSGDYALVDEDGVLYARDRYVPTCWRRSSTFIVPLSNVYTIRFKLRRAAMPTGNLWWEMVATDGKRLIAESRLSVPKTDKPMIFDVPVDTFINAGCYQVTVSCPEGVLIDPIGLVETKGKGQ